MFSCILFSIQVNFVFSQNEEVLNPKSYLSEKKIDHSIKTISESKYIPITDDETIEIDTVIIFDDKEYPLKLNSFSHSKFEPTKEIVSHYDSRRNKRTSWTYEYDDNDNLKCSVLNHKGSQNKIGNWRDFDNGFKYCQLYDEKNRIIKITQQDGSAPIQINAIINYRDDGLISKIKLALPWGENFHVYQAEEIGDTIRYRRSFETTKDKKGKKEIEIGEKSPIVFFNLIKDKNNYVLYREETESRTNKSKIVEKQVFDEEWNIVEKLKYEGEEINFHENFIYNNINEIIEIKNSLNSSSESYKYDNLGNLIFMDNNYLLIHRRYDERNNRVLDFKIYKDTGLLKEVSAREITYKEY
ncbi:MAG: hypothetical protein ACJATI_005582 [Halioglobus sp.]|jgi:hypothetical protein